MEIVLKRGLLAEIDGLGILPHTVDAFHAAQARRAGPQPREFPTTCEGVEGVEDQCTIVRHDDLFVRDDVEFIRNEIDVRDEDNLCLGLALRNVGQGAGCLGAGDLGQHGVGWLVKGRCALRECCVQVAGQARGERQWGRLGLVLAQDLLRGHVRHRFRGINEGRAGASCQQGGQF